MSLSSLRLRVLYRATLALERGAEDATFLPAGGGPERLIRIAVTAAPRPQQDVVGESLDTDEIHVRVAKDEAAEVDGTPLGGIASPANGDGLVRAGETADRVFSFAEVLQDQPECWLLSFRRKRRRQVGTAQTQK
jgi:hypothetical protein